MTAAKSQRLVRLNAIIRISIYGFMAFIMTVPFFTGGALHVAPRGFVLMSAIAGFLWRETLYWIWVLRTSRLFPDYSHALQRVQDGSTARLASILGLPQQKVRREVRLLSRLGLLPQVVMTRAGDFSYLGRQEAADGQWQGHLAQLENARQEQALKDRLSKGRQQLLGIACQSCGAQNKLAQGDVVSCAYCGSLVHLPEQLRL